MSTENEVTALTCHARIVVPDPETVILAVCNHMTEHEAELVRDGGAHVLRFGSSSARFVLERDVILVDVEAADTESIYFTRLAIASHIVEFAGEKEAQISWRGAGEEISRPPNFQILKVEAVTDVTPLM